jgi:hypothetical protein
MTPAGQADLAADVGCSKFAAFVAAVAMHAQIRPTENRGER